MSRALSWPLAILLASAPPAAARAQTTATAGGGAVFETYRFSDPDAVGLESLALITLPFSARADLSSRFALVVNGAFARGALSRSDGGESTVSGPTDTELRATFAAGGDALTLTAVALLPTGRSRLDSEEAEVAGAIAADVLPFRISNWGTGGGLGASVAAAVPLGGANAGVSAGYVIAREFEPIEGDDQFDYRPGNQLSLAAAIDFGVGGSGKLSLRASWLKFDTDEANGSNLYQSGDRLQTVGSYAFAAGPRASGLAYAGLLHRSRGEFRTNPLVTPAQDLFFAGLGFRVPLGPGILQPGLDVRVLGGDEQAGRGFTAGAGVSAELPVGSALLVPGLRGRFGNIRPVPGAESGYFGVEAGLAVRFGGR